MGYVIKRYSNRKLYDTQESRYVTLEEIEEMIRAGREISVVDAATGEDLTSVTLAQIILENERNRRAARPWGRTVPPAGCGRAQAPAKISCIRVASPERVAWISLPACSAVVWSCSALLVTAWAPPSMKRTAFWVPSIVSASPFWYQTMGSFGSSGASVCRLSQYAWLSRTASTVLDCSSA